MKRERERERESEKKKKKKKKEKETGCEKRRKGPVKSQNGKREMPQMLRMKRRKIEKKEQIFSSFNLQNPRESLVLCTLVNSNVTSFILYTGFFLAKRRRSRRRRE